MQQEEILKKQENSSKKIYSILKRNGYTASEEEFIKSKVKVLNPLWPSNFLEIKGITIDPYDKVNITDICNNFNEDLKDYKDAIHNGKIMNEAMFETGKETYKKMANKFILEAEKALNDCKGKDYGKTNKVYSTLVRVISIIFSFSWVEELFTFAWSVISLSFFKHYRTYFRDRINAAKRANDMEMLTSIKREANDINARLLKAKAKLKDPVKKKKIDENLAKLKYAIENAEKQINKL